MLKKRIIDEVKMTIAGRKILAALRLNVRLIKVLQRQYCKLVVEAEKKIKRNMLRYMYK